ncbi:YidH family protein [Peribacillus kribbensis]|uniref:YidH family protein n=1 Tax=Peribacillus kribbensis TaxID=356658 RepID=UPI000405739B|nr:DUF202 domain-containing protein [Peribacillus kribbensis]
MVEEKEQQTTDSKYIQQHLANERTYLAWVRTSITIIGVGFLITNLHFSTPSTLSFMGDVLAQVIGISSIAVGILTIILAAVSYFNKKNSINRQTFKAEKWIIFYLSLALLVVFLIFSLYYLFVWGII